MIDLREFPLRAPIFSLASVPPGNMAKKDGLPVLFRELQRKALAAPDLAHWRMLPTGVILAVTYTRDEDGPFLVVEFLRSITTKRPRDVPTFGNEVSAALIQLDLSKRVLRSHIDDRRHEPHYPCLRYLTLIAPKGGAA